MKKKHLIVDEIIIGAGLTGLTYGINSVEDQHSVAIFESHSKAGGYATNFLREKRKLKFDCSQHKITGLGENGNVRNALQRIQVWDKLNFKYYKTLSNIIVGDKTYKLPVGLKEAEQFLVESFPEDKTGIQTLFTDISTHGYQNYMYARMMLGEYELNRDILPESRQLQKLTTHEYFSKLFKNKDLIHLLGAIAIYLGAIANEANALYFLHYLYAAFDTKPGYIEGTSQVLSNTLKDTFLERGGIVSLNDPVEKIFEKDGIIIGLESKKHIVETKHIVATCSPHLIIDMLQNKDQSNKFYERMNDLQFGWGHFCVYIGIKDEPSQLGINGSEYLIVSEKGDVLTQDEVLNEERYNQLTLSVSNYRKIDPESGKIIQLIVLDHAANWFLMDQPTYEKQKENVCQILLERACKYFPKLKNSISYIECSTPRTNFKYTNSPEGSAFGYKVLPGENMRFLYSPPWKGIKFVGGWSTGPGYETAIGLGFAHSELMKRNRNKLSHQS